jgi:hypothetical protein
MIALTIMLANLALSRWAKRNLHIALAPNLPRAQPIRLVANYEQTWSSNGKTRFLTTSDDGVQTIWCPPGENSDFVPEGVTTSSIYTADHKAVVLLYRLEGGSYIWVGSAFFLTYFGFNHGKRTSSPRTYLVTAKHVAHTFGNDLYFSMPGGLIYHEPAASWLDHPELDMSLTDAKNMASLLGAKVFKPGKINRDTRAVKVLFADQIREKYSIGQLADRRLTKQTKATYSTTSDQGGAGTSGSPVFAGDVCVGVHSGFDRLTKSNCFAPFLFLDIYVSVKRQSSQLSLNSISLESANDNGALEADSVSGSFVSRDDLPDVWDDAESHGYVSDYDVHDDYEDNGYGHMTQKGDIDLEGRKFRHGVHNGASHYKQPTIKHNDYYESLKPYISNYGFEYPAPADRSQMKTLLDAQLQSAKIRFSVEKRTITTETFKTFYRQFSSFDAHFQFIQNGDPARILNVLMELIEKWPRDASAALGSLSAKTVGALTDDEKLIAARYACEMICRWRKNENESANKLMFFPFLKKELTKKEKLHRPRLVMLCNFAHNLAYHCVFKPVAEKFADDSKQTMTWYWPGKDPTYSRFTDLMHYLKETNLDRTIVNGDDCVSAKNFIIGGNALRLMISTDMTSFDCMHSQATVNFVSALFGDSAVVKTAALNAMGPSLVGFGTDDLYLCDDFFLKSGSSVTTLFNSVTRNFLELVVLAQLKEEYETVDALKAHYLSLFETTFNIKPKADLIISTTTYSINSHTVTLNYNQEFKGAVWKPQIFPVFVEFERLPRMLATLAYQANGSERNLAFELQREGFFSLLDVPPQVWPILQKEFGAVVKPREIIASFGMPYGQPNTEYLEERFIEDDNPFVDFRQADLVPKPIAPKPKTKPQIEISDMTTAQLSQYLATVGKVQLDKPTWVDVPGESDPEKIARLQKYLAALQAYERSVKSSKIELAEPEKSAPPPKILPVAPPPSHSVGSQKRTSDVQLQPESRNEKKTKPNVTIVPVTEEGEAAVALTNLSSKKKKRLVVPPHLSLDQKTRSHATPIPIVHPPTGEHDDFAYLDYMLNAYLFSSRPDDIKQVLNARYGKQVAGEPYNSINDVMDRYRVLCTVRYDCK